MSSGANTRPDFLSVQFNILRFLVLLFTSQRIPAICRKISTLCCVLSVELSVILINISRLTGFFPFYWICSRRAQPQQMIHHMIIQIYDGKLRHRVKLLRGCDDVEWENCYQNKFFFAFSSLSIYHLVKRGVKRKKFQFYNFSLTAGTWATVSRVKNHRILTLPSSSRVNKDCLSSFSSFFNEIGYLSHKRTFVSSGKRHTKCERTEWKVQSATIRDASDRVQE